MIKGRHLRGGRTPALLRVVWTVTALWVGAAVAAAPKVVQLPMRTDGPKSLDPVRGSTVYDNRAVSQVYETLLDYKYLVRPPELKPLLLAEMPEVSADRLTYTFALKRGVRFHDDPCFPGGKGREMVAKDVIYSWRRHADERNDPKSWWLFKDTVAGFDEYREEQRKAVANGAEFDYEAPVAGFKIIGDYKFQVVLKKPVYRFMWVLAMFQTSVVPREAVEKYGTRFGRYPVGTGPFILKDGDWQPGKGIVFHRNPNYHDAYYPKEHMPEDEKLGLHLAAGKRLPIVDRVEITMFVEDQPMWLQFRAGKIGYTQVPAEYFPKAYLKRRQRLKSSFRRQGIVSQPVKLLDFIFRGFNMEDKVVGGLDPKRRALRQAICLALDWEEQNDAFYNGINVVYDGPVPPGLDGHPEDGKAPTSYRGPDLVRARELLAKAGYPGGEGLPALEFYSNRGGNSPAQAEMLQRQLARIGVKLNVRLVDFSTLIEYVNNKKAQFFSFAWGSDYPDAENNLALFYSPNVSPGANHFNYANPEYDRLYEKLVVMSPSPERTRLIEKMRDMVIEDAPFAGSMARTRFYLSNPWLKNFKPSETFYGWIKYLDVDESKR